MLLLLLGFLAVGRQLSNKLGLRVFLPKWREASRNLSWWWHLHIRESPWSEKSSPKSAHVSQMKTKVPGCRSAGESAADEGISASLGKTLVFMCCSLFLSSKSPASTIKHCSEGLSELSCSLYFFYFFFEQSEVLRQYVRPFSSASLDDN